MNTVEPVVVAALYKFVQLADHKDLQGPLLAFCKDKHITGTLLLAQEGINGTVAGSRQSIDALCDYLTADPRFEGLEYKESSASEMPFHRMKVRLKKEIVTLGVAGIHPTRRAANRVEPEQWNELIADPDVLVLDTRNQYECDIGTFKNAVLPETETFREFPQFTREHLDPDKHKKIAMFCTGGIRCEKAGAYMLEQGFEEVYQLQGGILKYLEKISPEDSLWEGECFVFDGRVSVDEALQPGKYIQCFSCRRPVSLEAQKSDQYKQGISCPHCYDRLTNERRASLAERQHQVELAEKRNQLHIGAVSGLYKKDRKSLSENTDPADFS